MAPSRQGVRMICPPERHIAVEFQEIYSIIKGSLSVLERQKFEELSMLSECLYSQEFMVQRRNLKHNFLMFSTGAKEQALVTKVGRGLPTQADLDQREQQFVEDLLDLMAQARFSLLTQEEWIIARKENFMVHLPIEVNWEFYDTHLLGTFWRSSPERARIRQVLPELCERVLVFHRGVGVATNSGMFTDLKVDLLVEYLVVNPLIKLWRWLRRRPAPSDPLNTQTMRDSQHKNRKVVERRSLKILLPSVWDVLKNIHKTMHLQEPSFKEVVVMYRAANKGAQSHKLPALQRPKEERFKDILHRRNIHIKCFNDIPMADMDVIFADKKVYLKPLLLIQLAITVVGAIVAAVMVIVKSQGKVDYNVLWSALSLVGARCGQVWSDAQSSRSKTIQDMVNILYDKTRDAQEGVLTMLMEDMADQQLKEGILAYTLLLVKEAELSQNVLDTLCEDFLAKHFALHIDFAVEDALPRLLDWGLVRAAKGSPGKDMMRYSAVGVEEAVDALQARWREAYAKLTQPVSDERVPLTNLLPDCELPDISAAACSSSQLTAAASAAKLETTPAPRKAASGPAAPHSAVTSAQGAVPLAQGASAPPGAGVAVGHAAAPPGRNPPLQGSLSMEPPVSPTPFPAAQSAHASPARATRGTPSRSVGAVSSNPTAPDARASAPGVGDALDAGVRDQSAAASPSRPSWSLLSPKKPNAKVKAL